MPLPMQLVDSHCHLHMIDLTALGCDLDSILCAAKTNHVEQLLCVATHLADMPRILEIACHYPQVVASVGLHPNDTIDQEPTVQTLVALADHPRIVAIGETGLDHYRTQEGIENQRHRFSTHIRAAKSCAKPLIIHTRHARADTLSVLKKEQAQEVGGVLHCFTEDWETASQAMDMGFYISFSGIVTFKNAVDLHAVVKKMPLERLLIETDAPYLAPVPYRGQINQPAYVKYVAECVAALKEISVEQLALQTTENYGRLFSTPDTL